MACRLLVPAGNAEKGFTSLHAAAKNRQLELAKRLIKRGARPNIVDDSGRSPIHYAVENIDEEMVDLLTVNGATGSGRPNALHVAIEKGNEIIVEMLISRGAKINEKEPDGKTALHTAIETGNEKMYNILIKNGADIYARNNEGRTSIHIAVECGTIKILKILLDSYEEIDDRDTNGKTALHIASELKADDIIEILLDHDAGIDLTCNAGKTPLRYYDNEPRLWGWHGGKELLISQVIKMLGIGRQLNDKNVKTITGSRNFSVVYDYRCIDIYKEIVLTKSTNIGDSKISFYDILTSDVHRLASYARNKNIRESLLKSSEYESFYYYSKIINNRFKKGIRRNGLLLSSGKVLNAFSGYVLSDDTTIEILSYLGNMDLVNLTKAGSESDC